MARGESKQKRVIPGFGLSMGITVFYLSIIVLIPLGAVFLKTARMAPADFWAAVTSPRVLNAYKVSFGCAFIAAAINGVFGLILSYVLVRYRFPGRKIVDGLIDLPFALPTSIAGIALTAVYSENGWIGSLLYRLGIQSAFSALGITTALVFVGIPFVVRTVQPVLEGLDRQYEEAATMLGASRVRTFFKVVMPELAPALITGFALAFARGIGEYGSVIFISGNIPMKTEIAPLLIMSKLEQYDYAGATAIAVVILMISFAMLLLITLIQRRADRLARR
jgi:sulfate transport system permease protein